MFTRFFNVVATMLLIGFAACTTGAQEPIVPVTPETAGPATPAVSPPRLAAPTVALPPGESKETEAETITKCLRDLDSADVAQRRRAVLILGKYAAPVAQAAVLRSLQDPDDTIRQSALVSLTENEMMPPTARDPVLKLLGDPNVSIRRIASSSLREALIPSLRFLPMEATNVRISGTSGQFTPESKVLLNRALEDTDPIVRKNILTLAPMLAEVLETEPLRRNLVHEDKEIRVLALLACEMLMASTPEQFLQLVTPLAADREAVVREAVARSLGRCGSGARELFLRLAEDTDAGVKIAALEGLGRMRDKTVMDKAGDLLRDEGIPLDDKRRLLMLLPTYGETGVQMLLDLARKSSPALQVEALRQLSYQPPATVPLTQFQEFIASPAKELRTQATAGLMRQATELKPEFIATLCASPYADVRLTGSYLVDRLPPEKATAVIGDFILDDAVEVRTAGLQLAVIRQIPEWVAILRQSLDDANPEIRRAAVDALLLRPTPESRQLLENLQQNTPDPELKEYLRQRLQVQLPAGGLPRPPPRIQPRIQTRPLPPSPLAPR